VDRDHIALRRSIDDFVLILFAVFFSLNYSQHIKTNFDQKGLVKKCYLHYSLIFFCMSFALDGGVLNRSTMNVPLILKVRINFFFAGTTYNGTFRGIFRGGLNLFDLLIVLSVAKDNVTIDILNSEISLLFTTSQANCRT
jgi:hypothetical protein